MSWFKILQFTVIRCIKLTESFENIDEKSINQWIIEWFVNNSVVFNSLWFINDTWHRYNRFYNQLCILSGYVLVELWISHNAVQVFALSNFNQLGKIYPNNSAGYRLHNWKFIFFFSQHQVLLTCLQIDTLVTCELFCCKYRLRNI